MGVDNTGKLVGVDGDNFAAEPRADGTTNNSRSSDELVDVTGPSKATQWIFRADNDGNEYVTSFIISIEQDDAVGQCLHGGDQPVGFGNPALDLSPQVLFVAVDTAENAIPGTQRLESGIGGRRPRPAIEPGEVAQLEEQLQPEACTENCPTDPGCHEMAQRPGDSRGQQNQQ